MCLERKCRRLKAFLQNGLMNEHSVGFALKEVQSLVGEEREQALTVKVEEEKLSLFN